MSVSSVLGGRAFLDGFTLGDNIAQLTEMSWSAAQLDKGTIEHRAAARLDGLKDGRMAVVAHYDTATGKSRDVLSDFPVSTANRLLTWAHRPTLGAATISCLGRQTNLDTRLNQDGDLLLDAAIAGNGFGVEGGHLLTAGLHPSEGAESLTGINDVDAATDWGLQAYLHVVNFTGTSVTVTIQDSDDNGSGDAYAAVPGAAFAAATAPGFQRIQTSRTENVKEWLRVVLTGTYTVADLVVAVVPNRLGAVNF